MRAGGGISFAEASSSFTVTNGAMGLAFAGCGALLAWHRPRNPIGWLFLAAGLAQATSTAASSLLALASLDGWSLGALRLLGTLIAYPWPFSIGMFLPIALLLFPDGRPAGRRWRWLIWAALVDGALFVLSFASPAPLEIDGYRVTLYLTIRAYAGLSPLWTATKIAVGRRFRVGDRVAGGAVPPWRRHAAQAAAVAAAGWPGGAGVRGVPWGIFGPAPSWACW